MIYPASSWKQARQYAHNLIPFDYKGVRGRLSNDGASYCVFDIDVPIMLYLCKRMLWWINTDQYTPELHRRRKFLCGDTSVPLYGCNEEWIEQLAARESSGDFHPESP